MSKKWSTKNGGVGGDTNAKADIRKLKNAWKRKEHWTYPRCEWQN
jgi:hypothetical protein